VSTALAIAAVSAALKNLLSDGLLDADLAPAVGDVTVSALPPDRIAVDGTDARSQLNLFMYQATPNAALRNLDLPVRDAAGERVSNAPLALDLHYLLSAYGTKDLHAEILLGYAMQLLHETPQLARDALRNALATATAESGLPAHLRPVGASELAEQMELVKLTPQALSGEELARLWSAFGAKYRPTAAYTASVVLIERRARVRAARPVLARNLLVRPLRRPFIETVMPSLAETGEAVTLIGRGLAGSGASVRFGDLAAVPTRVADDAVEVDVPAALPAGVHTVSVVQTLDFGTPVEPHAGLVSNAVALMVLPRISSHPASVARGGSLSLRIAPEVDFDQEAAVLLGDTLLPVPPRPTPPSGPARGATLACAVPADFATGDHLLRVRIDGADSRLVVDTNPASPTYGQFVGPTVNVT
jgi:hypothetical protein